MPTVVPDNSSPAPQSQAKSQGKREESSSGGFETLFEVVQASVESGVSTSAGWHEAGMGRDGGAAETAEERNEQLARKVEKQEAYRDAIKDGRQASKNFRERRTASKAQKEAEQADAAGKKTSKHDKPNDAEAAKLNRTAGQTKNNTPVQKADASGTSAVRSETDKAEQTKPAGTDQTPQSSGMKATLPTSVQSPGTPDAASIQSASIAKQIGQSLGAKVSSSGTSATPPVGAVTGTSSRGNTPATTSKPQANPESHQPQSQARAGKASETEQSDFNRLVKSIRMNIGQKESSARLHLNPPELGRIRVDVKMSDQRISIEIQTENPEAREVLGSRIETLREGLASSGIDVEKMELASVFPDGPQDADQQEQASSESRHSSGDGDRNAAADNRATGADEKTEDESVLDPGADTNRVVSETQLDIRV